MKKLLSLLFLPLFLFIVFQAHATGSNLALNQPIVANNQLGATWSASKADDANQTTYWESVSHTFPNTLTVDLGTNYVVSQVILKLPSAWGNRTETLSVNTSLDNITFTQAVASANYSIGTNQPSITFTPTTARYVQLRITNNLSSPASQISEFEVYGDPVPTPTPTATPTPTPTPSPTPTPPDWAIQGMDVMKYSKDVVCNQTSQATVDMMTTRAATAGANFVAISTQYDTTATGACGGGVTGDPLPLTTKWVNSIRAHGMHVWFRMMGNSFEGINGKTKTKNLTAYTAQIVAWYHDHPTLVLSGDIITPTPEPDSAGISGVTYCPTSCQFSNAAEYNTWIQNTQTAVKAEMAAQGKTVKVGYYGHSPFIVWGENNPDWQGQSFLTQATVDSMDGVIAMDSYPETYGGTMAGSIAGAHTKWPSAHLVISEWGTITAGTDAQKEARVIASMGAAKQTYVDGFNYWNLGPAGNEGLLVSGTLAPTAWYDEVSDFYHGIR